MTTEARTHIDCPHLPHAWYVVVKNEAVANADSYERAMEIARERKEDCRVLCRGDYERHLRMVSAGQKKREEILAYMAANPGTIIVEASPSGPVWLETRLADWHDFTLGCSHIQYDRWSWENNLTPYRALNGTNPVLRSPCVCITT